MGLVSTSPQPAHSKRPPEIAFDLDGTLAKYDRWRGLCHIGEPVPAMLTVLRQHLARGDTCVIFTARVFDRPEAAAPIHAWLESLGIPRLEVTCMKRPSMRLFYDDKAAAVKINEGERSSYSKHSL